MAGTTPKARAVGAELRSAREAAGLGLRQLAEKLETSHATISRWETGARSPKPEDVAAYLAKVGAGADLREQLVELARDPDGAHWLSVGMPNQHRQLTTLLEIEREATRITTVSPLLVPGLLQTADYARAIMTTGGVPVDEIDTRVAVRIGRRDAITRRRKPVALRAYIGEAVLSQLIGGEDVMADQLRELTQLGQRANVEIRIVPIRSGWYPGLEGLFSIAEFDNRDAVVHLENRISGLFLHEPDEVAVYANALGRMEEVAMSPADSARVVAAALEEVETTP